MRFRDYILENTFKVFRNFIVYVNPTTDEYDAIKYDKRYRGMIPVCIDVKDKKVYAWHAEVTHWDVIHDTLKFLYDKFEKGDVILGYYEYDKKNFVISEVYDNWADEYQYRDDDDDDDYTVEIVRNFLTKNEKINIKWADDYLYNASKVLKKEIQRLKKRMDM